MAPKTALLVIDMQNFFSSMTTTALPNVKKLISFFQSTSAPIVFTQHGHTTEELTTVPSPNQLVRKWGPGGSIAQGSDDWELQDAIKELLPGSNSPAGAWPKLIDKNTYDAFINTDLARVLEGAGVDRAVVCGVMTDCCCDTTARSAFNRGYETWLVSDACGSANKTQHQAGLKGFGFAFGEVLTTNAAIKLLKDGE
ncbi:Nicotinamidase 3 [Cytospora mali]|uniref:Nicotinamidase 3 n=1 Tax=Cytospora mali TaxID=578113 RepID=A0A194UU90_CYTMA|nr:Nicotinamidase 3 [Valsa mali var. pyri (nom. inval.)]